MKRNFYIYLAIFFTVFFFAGRADAIQNEPEGYTKIYSPGSDKEASFGNAIDSFNLLKTPKIIAIASLAKNYRVKNPKNTEERYTNGLYSLKAIVFYARENLNPKVKLEADLLQSIESVWCQLLGSQPIDDLSRNTNWKIEDTDFTVKLIPDKLILDFKTTYLESNNKDAFKNAIDTLGILQLMFETLNYFHRKSAFEKIETIVKERKAQWQVYFDKSVPQWPWEYALNGLIYKHSIKKQKALGKVPEWQLIFVHPEAAMEYIDIAADGNQFKPALMIEIIGADFWRWEKRGKQKGPWKIPCPIGAGFVATISDRAGMDDLGLGGIIRFNHVYSIGATFRDGDIGIFVNVNFGKPLVNNYKKVDKYLDMVGLSPF